MRKRNMKELNIVIYVMEHLILMKNVDTISITEKL